MSSKDKKENEHKKDDEDKEENEEGEREVLEELLSPNFRADQERKLAERAAMQEALNRESARIEALQNAERQKVLGSREGDQRRETLTPLTPENACDEALTPENACDEDESSCVLQVLQERTAMARTSMEKEKMHAYAGTLAEQINGRSRIPKYLDESDASQGKEAHTRSRLVQYLDDTLGPQQKKVGGGGPEMIQSQTTPAPPTAVAQQVPATEQTVLNVGPQPGAFRGALGENLERTDRLRYSLVGAAAIDASGLSGFATSDELSRALSANPSLSREFANLGAGGVAEANPVSDREITMMEAQPVDQEEAKRRKLQKRRFHCFLAFAFACLILAVAAICGIVLQKKGDNTTNASTSAPSPSPTQVPSSTPSSAPSSTLQGLNAMVFPDHTMESLQDPFSPQFQAYDWLSKHPNITFMEQSEMQQQFAMATFFFAMGGPQWLFEIRESWLDYERPSCYWFSDLNGFTTLSLSGDFSFYDRGGIPCNENGQLFSLGLGNFDFSMVEGPFVPPEVGLLPALEQIIIQYNELSAPISDFLSPLTLQNLPNLKCLWLTGNPLSGQVPSEFGLMTKLKELYFGHTKVAGPLPTELFQLTDLEMLGISKHGLDRIPSELGLLTDLTHLEADFNNLSVFPSEILQLRRLQTLYLDFNSISGPIPTQLGLLLTLEHLGLESNYLSGQIPTEFAHLENLGALLLGRNLLSGPVPSGVYSATDLSALLLSHNSLSGPMPSELGLFSLLIAVEMHSNSFTGTIPTELGLLENLFFQFDLSSNHLSGTIPSELSLLVNLTGQLNLRSNSLSGSIPTELGLLSSLFGFLDLSDNLLTSTIPTELGLIPYLHSISLDGNSITGTIPSNLGQVQTLLNLGLSHLSLTGSIPDEVASLAAWGQLQQLDISNNINLTGTLPEELCFLETTDCFCFHPDLCKTTSCLLEFDCTDRLCGCGCDC